MNIYHLYDEHWRVSPDRGSVATVIYNITSELASSGHDVTVLERQWDGLPKRETRDGVSFRRFGLPVDSDQEGESIPYQNITSPTGLGRMMLDRLHFAWKLRRYLAVEEVDILHVHLPFTANVLIHLCPSLREKMVYTAHVGEEDVRFGISDDAEPPLPLRLVNPDIHLMKRVAASVVLNDPLQEFLSNEGLETEMIPNGVDVGEFPVSAEAAESVRAEYDEDVLVLFLGTITKRKGVDTLVSAAKELTRTTDASVRFILAGNRTVDEEFTATIEDRVAADDLPVTLTGYIEYEHLRNLLTASDIFVLPSREEGSPMSLNEALASGLPAIGSNVSGIPAQIKEGRNGLLFEPGDVDGLRSALQTLIADPEKRESMATESRRLAESKFSWASITRRYLSIYRGVANR